MASRAIEILRGAASVVLFGVFGIGSLLLAPLMLALRTTERCQPVVRAVWRPLVGLFVGLGLIRIDRGNLPDCRGTVIVANHPSLIDVVLFVTLVPRTLYVAKESLWHSPFLSAIVRATSLPQDATLCEVAAPYLEKGWNVLLFPEGARSPEKGLGPFRRGAAQLALRTSAPVVCVGLRLSRRLLAKRQAAWDMGPRRVIYSFRADAATIERVKPGESRHAAAIRITEEFGRRVMGLWG